MREETLQRIKDTRVIAIVRGLIPEMLQRLATALCEGGISLVELTFAQTPPMEWRHTAEGIALLNRTFGGRLLAGAGTVMTLEQLHMAHEAGARYIISPNIDPEIIRETRRLGMVSLPGGMTPTDIVTAHQMGADMVKVFPAASLGAGYFKALKAPLPHIPLLAVGGVNDKNAAEFIRAGAVGLGIGGNLANKEWIQNGEYTRIKALAETLCKTVCIGDGE